MRAFWVTGAAILTTALSVGGCAGLLGDFTAGSENGMEDGSVLGDGSEGSPDTSLAPNDSGSDQTAPPPEASTADAPLDAPGPEADAGTPVISISPASHDFLSFLIGTSSPSQAFTVTNTGKGESGALAVVLTPASGTLATEFPVTDGCTGKTLAPTSTCTVSVLMTPGSAGAKAASLVVSGAPGGSATTSLSGTGLSPAMLTISPAPYAFVASPAGASGPTQVFTVTNGGGGATTSALTTALTVGSGTSSTELVITADTCRGQTLGALQTCKITVQFNPATYGAKSASLSINGGPPTATITGTGEDTLILTVAKTGIGTGTITDDSGMIDCGTTCKASYTRTTSDPVITLTATPDPSSTFAGWTGGGCSGTGTCVVTLSAATTVSAQLTCSICSSACVNEQSDPGNCGACGHSCLGSTCTAGMCDPVSFYAPAGLSPAGVAADSSYVYWIAEASGSYGKVQVCPNASGLCTSAVDFMAATPNATSGLPSAYGLGEGGGFIAAVGEGISDGTNWGGGRMESCPIVSSTTATTCSPTPEGVNGGGTGGFFQRVVTDGVNIASFDSVIYLATVGQSSLFSVSMPHVFSSSTDDQIEGLALGSSGGNVFLYWTVAESGGFAGTDSHKIFRCQIGGGAFPCSTTPTPLTAQLVYDGGTSNRNPGAIVFDATAQALYWLDQGSTPNPPPNTTDGKLLTCSLGALPCTPVALVTGLAGPIDLAQDASTLYYATRGGLSPTVQLCAKAGCSSKATLIASNEPGIQFIAADPSATGSVFWTTFSAVRRVAKP